jgi:hypothetical protein
MNTELIELLNKRNLRFDYDPFSHTWYIFGYDKDENYWESDFNKAKNIFKAWDDCLEYLENWNEMDRMEVLAL